MSFASKEQLADFRSLIELARKSTSRTYIPSPLKEAVKKHLDDLNPNNEVRFWAVRYHDGRIVQLVCSPNAMYFDCGTPLTLVNDQKISIGV